MATRPYGQYCGVARAAELIGERWTLLVIRDLLLGPKRFTDLQRGLGRVPTNVLSSRLKDLESNGVVQRRLLPRPSGAVVYELTPYGRELEDIVVKLLLWGMKSLGDPGPDDTVASNSFVLGLRASFQPEAARDLSATYELHLDGHVFHARVEAGELEVGEGTAPDPDATIDTGVRLAGLLRGEMTAEEAVSSGAIRFAGDPALLERFAELFQLPSSGKFA